MDVDTDDLLELNDQHELNDHDLAYDQDHASILLHGVRDALETGLFTDVAVYPSQPPNMEPVYFHSLILACGSPYLRVLLETEKNEDTVLLVPGVLRDTILNLRSLLYTGDAGKVSDELLEVLQVLQIPPPGLREEIKPVEERSRVETGINEETEINENKLFLNKEETTSSKNVNYKIKEMKNENIDERGIMNKVNEEEKKEEEDNEDDEDVKEEELNLENTHLKLYLPPASPSELKRKRIESETSEKEETEQTINETNLSNEDQAENLVHACNICDRVVPSGIDLKEHMKIHLDVPIDNTKPYKCQNCPSTFRWRSEFKLHSESTHGIKVIEVQRCEFCSKDIVCSRYREHVRSVHNKERPYSCDVCEKTFTKPKELKNHKRSHTGEKPYACKQCGARFSISHLLLRHLRYHDGVTKYNCDQCNKSFMQKNDLAKHSRIHTGEKPFKCDVCERSFARNDYLRKHQHLHQNSEGFLCSVCKTTFSTKENLKKHMVNHNKKQRKKQVETVLLDQVKNQSFMYFIHESSGNESLTLDGETTNCIVIPHPSPLIVAHPSPPHPQPGEQRLQDYSTSQHHASPLLSAGVPSHKNQMLQGESECEVLEDVVPEVHGILQDGDDPNFILPDGVQETDRLRVLRNTGIDNPLLLHPEESHEILYTIQYP